MMNSVSKSQIFNNSLPYDYNEVDEDCERYEVNEDRAAFIVEQSRLLRRPSFITFDIPVRSSSLETSSVNTSPINISPIHNRPLYRNRYPSPPPPEISIYDKMVNCFYTIKEFIIEIVEYSYKSN